MDLVIGLHHIALNTCDTVRSIEFYKHFGAEVIDQTETYVTNAPGLYWKLTLLKISDFVIELKEPSALNSTTITNDGFFNHICIKVINVEKIVENLKDTGIRTFVEPIIREHKIYGPKGIKNAFLRGPDGEQIELMEYLY